MAHGPASRQQADCLPICRAVWACIAVRHATGHPFFLVVKADRANGVIMPHQRALTALFAFAVGMSSAFAQPSGADWKLFGTNNVLELNWCFFDVNTLVRGTNGHTRVWTKCISLTKLNEKIKDSDQQLVEDAARKHAGGYQPPILKIEPFDLEQRIHTVALERLANIGGIKPTTQIFMELNCSERMYREVNIHVDYPGHEQHSYTPREWKYAPPESNGATLLKLVCS